MNKGKSIFSKYFVICSAVILISFVCLGAVLLLVSSRYFIEDRKALLKKNCEGAAHEISEAMLADPSEWKELADEIMKEYAMGCNAHFVLADKNGQIIDKTYGSDFVKTSVSAELLDEIDEENYYVYDNFGGLTSESSHVCGKKFSANGPEYFILAATETSEDNAYIYDEELALKCKAIFENDLLLSKEITLDEVKSWKWYQRFPQWLIRQAAPLL